ncbi:DUF4283 domain-containing protein [Artemisia annua]|uniref:DUF4283 domain-containing protein n=1 Tax=Artemisia annua TaxID=35608 RepID=A0A2U1Q675_ARTAN|nr:DUF4283 domain-containing protein [Artemisia annua]
MSEQEPKPPNPNELLSPPPVVNPPSSRTDKNLKTKKTTRTMNPKPTNTMRHHEMLNKSTDVNFKKVMTRSSSKGSEADMGMEEMDCGDEAGNSTGVKEGLGDVNGNVLGVNEGVAGSVVAEKSGVDKGKGTNEGVFCNEANGNVSDMFPELNSSPVSQGNNGNVSEIPVPFEQNPILNPQARYGRASFARVLIEVDATKGIVDSVELWYRKLNRTMQLRVEYAWQPPICSHCCVFGHSYNGCKRRVISEEERIERSKAKVQGVPDVNTNTSGNSMNEGWQSVQANRGARNGGEPLTQQSVQSNPGGSGTARNGVFMGRGGPSFRGRGGYGGRGGFNGVATVNEKRYDAVKNTGKDKESVMVDKQQQSNKEVAVGEGIKKNEVKHIAQRDFKTSNRYAALANDNGDDMVNELQGIKVNIDVACEMGIPIDDEVSSKWPEDLQQYYKDKCVNMHKGEKIVMLQNKIQILEKEIVSGRNGIDANSKKKADEGVVFEMESTGFVTRLLRSLLE